MWRKNEFISPSIKGFKVFCDDTELSTARMDVVPTNKYVSFGFGTVHNIAGTLA
jgi:hypothetical protein